MTLLYVVLEMKLFRPCLE